MTTNPPPGDDLTPPGPAAAPDPDPQTGGQSIEEWLARNGGAQGAGPTGTWSSYSPYPIADPPRASKTLAKWALGFSLAICVPFAFVVAIVLAITVLVQSRDGRDHGKWMAVVALAISGLLLLANVGYVVWVGVDMWRNGWDETERDAQGNVTERGLVSIDRLQVGDCLLEMELEEEVDEGEVVLGEALAVPCDEPHVAEVFAINPIDPAEHRDQQSLDRASVRTCVGPFRDYVGRPFHRSEYELFFYNPSVAGDATLEDEVVCVVAQPDGPEAAMIEHSSR